MSADGLPPLTWLRAFEASARHLSFTRAAAELNLTQSAISQHVRSLEAFLGHELFTRRTRAIALTEAGGSYLPVVREAFDLLAAGTLAFTGGGQGRNLVLQCNMGFSVLWLAPRLHRLHARHPWLVLNIVTPIWDPDRHAAKAAVEIRFGREAEMSASAERLSQERFYPVCRPDFQAGRPDPETARLLDCAGLTGTWSAWFRSQGWPFARDGEVTLTSTFVIAIQAALHGAGMAMAHDMLVADLLREGRLIRPFGHAPPMAEAYYLMPPPSHAATPASVAFVEWLREEIADRLPP
ncbi:transcriptional regulator GcvA [Paralimibaculum aggregatum]|uniref:Transcriptional regulator GcvA n=1 Tax=Paralimibaculum aggregatum TaxID=3036245 RepID=A0ABQ6LJ02_9RHOB|nr:LysR family transcriptional regulator [Limibaculum sp. NKW23]GMG82134.1 transcriptional regulator GcvA [Limibaculum sp. NKW23]